LDFLVEQGVGSKDVVASSPKSYISYLNSVSKLICQDITPEILQDEADIKKIVFALSGKRKANTIRNYSSAMRKYVEMVKSKKIII
jgi:hypothetical protein